MEGFFVDGHDTAVNVSVEWFGCGVVGLSCILLRLLKDGGAENFRGIV